MMGKSKQKPRPLSPGARRLLGSLCEYPDDRWWWLGLGDRRHMTALLNRGYGTWRYCGFSVEYRATPAGRAAWAEMTAEQQKKEDSP